MSEVLELLPIRQLEGYRFELTQQSASKWVTMGLSKRFMRTSSGLLNAALRSSEGLVSRNLMLARWQ